MIARRATVLLSMFFVVVGSVTHEARSAPTLDQFYEGPSGGAGNVGAGNAVDWAQSFTAGLSGLLTRVDLHMERNAAVTQELLFDIRTAPGNDVSEPDVGPNILLSVAVPASEFSTTAGWTTIDLAAQGLFVSAGDELAIALQSDDPGGVAGVTYQWSDGGNGSGYLPGLKHIRTATSNWTAQTGSNDFLFRTFVDPTAVPEPASSSVLALLAFAGVVGRRRRRRQRM